MNATLAWPSVRSRPSDELPLEGRSSRRHARADPPRGRVVRRDGCRPPPRLPRRHRRTVAYHVTRDEAHTMTGAIHTVESGPPDRRSQKYPRSPGVSTRQATPHLTPPTFRELFLGSGRDGVSLVEKLEALVEESRRDLHKRCGGCQGWLPADVFPPDRRASTGLGSWCYGCRRVYWRRWRAEHPEKVAAYNEARRAKARAARRELRCSECGQVLEGRKSRVCSPQCRDRRYRRLHPEQVAAKQHRKYLRRRDRQQERSAG